MKKRKVFFNNKFVTEDLAKISIYDSALMFGDMVFEMTGLLIETNLSLKNILMNYFMV